jgi:hypothetical protein
MFSKIIENYKCIPKTVGYKLVNRLATLSDEEEACTKPEWAYMFARDIPGANIEKCQESACKDLEYAYMFALSISGANIEKCQEAACKDGYFAYCFAKHVPEINLDKC